jgi:ribosomal protein L30E
MELATENWSTLACLFNFPSLKRETHTYYAVTAYVRIYMHMILSLALFSLINRLACFLSFTSLAYYLLSPSLMHAIE